MSSSFIHVMYCLQQLLIQSELWAFQLGKVRWKHYISPWFSCFFNDTEIKQPCTLQLCKPISNIGGFYRIPQLFLGMVTCAQAVDSKPFFYVYRVPWVRNYDYALQLWYGHPKPYLYLSGIRCSQWSCLLPI